MNIEVSADINRYQWMIFFIKKKELIIQKKLVFLKDKINT
jgi:hypothetical protein